MKEQIFETQLIVGKFGYGIPDNLISKIDNRFIPIGNVRFKWRKSGWSRHYKQTCPECGKRKKNIRFHYKTIHPKFYEKIFIKPFKKAQIGEIYGIRFIETKLESKSS